MLLPTILHLTQPSDLSSYKTKSSQSPIESLRRPMQSIIRDLSVNSLDSKAYLNATFRRLFRNLPSEKNFLEEIKVEIDKIEPGKSSSEEVKACIEAVQNLWQVRRAG